MFFNLPQNTPAISYTAEYDQSLLIAVEHDLHFARVYLVTSVFNEEMVVDEDDTTVRDDSMINTIKNKILIQSIKFYGDNPTQMEYITNLIRTLEKKRAYILAPMALLKQTNI